MKILGLILELNPFHNGHKYFIDKAIEEVKPDLTVAVISTSFCMRGEISILDKFTKTKLCLENNIDVVLELPFIYGVNSSDHFSHSAIKILNEFNITDLAFGSEVGNIDFLNNLNKITESISFNNSLKKYLDSGSSYSNASLKALMDETDNQDYIKEYSLPNNTLALSYLKEIRKINPSILPHTIKRIDNQYYDLNTFEGKLPSASALRKMVNDNLDISSFIPSYEYDFIKDEEINQKIFTLLKYNFLDYDFKNIVYLNEGIENRFKNFIDENTYDSFIRNVQTKRYPLNHIKRCLIHILAHTNFKTDMTYLRVLGINNKGLKYLKKLKDKNIITNTKAELDKGNKILAFELKITKLYDLLTNKNTFKNEFILQVNKNDN